MKNTIQLAESAARRSMSEQIDPKLFGRLRSLIAMPFEGEPSSGRYGDTFLTMIWQEVAALLDQGASSEELENTVYPYLDGALSRMNERFLSLSALHVGRIMDRKLKPDEQRFYERYQRSIQDERGGLSVDGVPALDALTKLRLGNLPHDAAHQGFRIEVDKAIFTRRANLRELLTWAGASRSDLQLGITYDFDESSLALMARAFVGLLKSNPSGLATVFTPGFQTMPERAEGLFAFLAAVEKEGSGDARGDVTLSWPDFLETSGPVRERLDLLKRHKLITSYKSALPGGAVLVTF